MPASVPLFPALIPALLSASTDLARYRGSHPVPAATSREQVNRSRQERDLTGCCILAVSRLGSGRVCAVGGWVASLVLLRVGCGRSYLPVSGSFGAGLGLLAWVVFAARGGCVLWQFHRAVPCSAPMGGFRSARQALRFWWCWGGLFFCGGFPVRFSAVRWRWRSKEVKQAGVFRLCSLSGSVLPVWGVSSLIVK